MAFRRNLWQTISKNQFAPDVVTLPTAGAGGEFHSYTAIAPALGDVVTLPHPFIADDTLSLFAPDGSEYVAGEDFSFAGENMWRNLAILEGSAVRVEYIPEDGEGGRAIALLAGDPASPVEGDVWIRGDKTPPELRLFLRGLTFAAAFAEVASEVKTPLRPSATLRPPFYPRGFADHVNRARYPRSDLRPPFGPRS